MERIGVRVGARIQGAQLAIGRAAASCERVDDFLGRVAAVAADAVGARAAGFWRLDPDGEHVSHIGAHAGAGSEAAVVRSLLLDAGTDERPEIRSTGEVLAVVWRAGGTRLGALCAYGPEAEAGFNEDDGDVLRALAYSAGTVYERLEVVERLAQAEGRLAHTLEISRTLNSILDPDELVETLVAQAMSMLGCEAGTAGLRRSDGMASKRFLLGDEVIPLEFSWPPGQGTPGWALVHRAPYMTNDAVHDAQFVSALRDRLVVERALTTPIIDANGEVLGFFSLYNKPGQFDDDDLDVMRGLANQAALALQNALAYRRLGELEQVKSDFLNLAAHELRGPIATARGHIEMLADSRAPWSAEQRAAMLAMAAHKLDHIRFLVDQMLTTARLEEQRLELDLEVVDLRELVDAARRDVAYAVKPDHRMTMERGREPILVRVDRRRIEPALANLFENACKYSPEGGEIVVRCRASDTPAWAEVSVEDHGVGIAEEDLPHLFTRFGRIVTTENSHIPGTGLGLYLSRQLALLHGGDIIVDSTPGEGSRFSLRLPLVAPAGEIPAAEVFRRQAEDMAKQQGGLDTAPSAMLPGENPSTLYAQDARHWATVYQELVKIKEDILGQLHARGHRTHAAQSQVDREGESLKIEIERLRAHLLYWQERAKSLES